MLDFSSAILRAQCGRTQARRVRGFIHILFLVLTILGLSLWGVSELVFQVTDIEQEGDAEKATSLHESRRALMEYALNAPPRLNIENRAGRFSALAFREDTIETAVPYRYFSLPCPDVGADGNWDGIADVLYPEDPAVVPVVPVIQTCGDLVSGLLNTTSYLPNVRGSRTGRFPWRTFNGQIGGRFAYVHGAGNRDIIDNFGNRPWYVAALNMTREDRPLNLHWQMRQESGWLRLADLTEIAPRGFAELCPTGCGPGEVPPPPLVTAIQARNFGRVAAVAIAPGVRGPNNQGVRGPESTNMTSAVVTTTSSYEAYLEQSTYSELRASGIVTLADFDANLSPLILYESIPEAESRDAISYFTIDDLAAQGEHLFSDEGGAIADLLEGRDGHLGVVQLMQAHFTRYGYLPAPAAFGRRAAESTQRRSGAPPAAGLTLTVAGSSVVIDVQAGAVGPNTVMITALLPVRNIGRVYLQPGSRLEAESVNSFGGGLPPYNLALYGLESEFNETPMQAAVRDELLTDDMYPHENLFGFRPLPEINLGVSLDIHRLAAESPSLRDAGNQLVPLDSRVYMSRPPPLRNLDIGGMQITAPGQTVYVALAEPALAYIQTDNGLGGQVALADRGTADIAESPSYGVQVKLPPGTRFVLTATAEGQVTMFLPSRLDVRGSNFDPMTGELILREQLSQPAIVADNSDRFITVTAVLNTLAVDSANIGFLPVADGAVIHLDTAATLSLGNPIIMTLISGVMTPTVMFPTLPGGDVSVTVAGGVALPYNQAVSRLPTDLQLFTNARLIITPFPPPGRLAAPGRLANGTLVFDSDSVTALAIPSVLFINFNGFFAVDSTEFTLPAGAQVYYPPDAEIALGEDFAFPLEARALLPPGAVMTVEILPQSNLPGGLLITNTVLITRAVTLVHGGIMELSGQVHDPAADPIFGPTLTYREGARIVLKDGFGIGSAQEMFDIELQTPYLVASDTTSTAFVGGAVVLPLTGRGTGDSIAPISASGTVVLRTWTRARFLTRGRNLPHRGNVLTEGGVIHHVTAGIFSTVNAMLVNNVRLPGAAMITMTVRARIAETDGVATFTMTMRINEQTEFMIPPGTYPPDDLFSTGAVSSDLGTRMLATVFTFPNGTAIYDPNIPSLDGITVRSGGNDIDGFAVLVGTLQVETATTIDGGGVVVHQLVLQPDSDVLLNDEVLPGGGIIDVVQGFAWPPGSIYTLPGVSPDLSATSARQIYLYFSSAVTLTSRAATVIDGVFTGPPPGVTATTDISFLLATVTMTTFNRAGFTEAFCDGLEDADGNPVCSTMVITTTMTVGALTAFDTAPPDGTYLSVHLEEAVRHVYNNADSLNWRGDLVPFSSKGNYTEQVPAGLKNDMLVLPPGTFVLVPPGSTLNFLSPSGHGTSIPAAEADYMFLPRDAVAVLPHGESATLAFTDLGTGVVSDITLVGADDRSPVQIRLGGGFGRGLAMVAHSTYMSVSPMVFYEGDTFLLDTEAPIGVRDDVVARIPAGTRGDIFGNITRREGLNFALDLLPSDTGEFLRNFPMVYAVAGECRAGYTSSDSDGACAEAEGEGLEFAVDADEMVVLEEDLIAGGNILISVHSDLAGTVSLTISIVDADDFYAGNLIGGMELTVSRVFIDGDTGAVTPGTLSAIIPAGNVGIISPVALSAADAEMRVYMNLTTAMGDDFAPELEDAHYVVLSEVTVFAGGFTASSSLDTAGFQLTLTTTRSVSNAASNMQIGFGAQVGGDSPLQSRFGIDSYIEQPITVGGPTVRIPLDQFSVVNHSVAFQLGVNAASRYANLDSAGEITFQTEVGDRLLVTGTDMQVLARDAPLASRPATITLDTSSSIDMAQGYLWQGYLDANGSPDVSLAFSTAIALTTGGVLKDEMFMRVHPADELLNFWGSGLERSEGMDSRSIARKPQVDLVRSFRFVDYTAPEEYVDVFLFIGDRDLITLSITAPVPDTGVLRTAEYVANLTWRFGWSTALPAATGAPLHFRVRDAATGNIVEDDVLGAWVPHSRSGYAVDIAVDRGQGLVPGRIGWGGANAAPFDVPDQAYISNTQEIWAHRQMVQVKLSVVADPGDAQDGRHILPANDDSMIELMVNGTAVSTVFNMPAHQLRGRALRPSPAWTYDMKAADIRPVPVGDDIPECVVLGEVPPSYQPYTRVPGTLLGRFPDTERDGVVSCTTLAPGFSGRLRRESVFTTVYTSVFTTVDLVTISADDSTTVVLSRDLVANLRRPQTRVTLPVTVTSTPVDAEVRAATGNAPEDYNPTGSGLGDPAVATLENPASYIVPGPHIQQTLILEQGVPSSVSSNDMRVALSTSTRTTPVLDGMVFYMDRAYTPVSQLPIGSSNPGIPPQQMALGGDFRIAGPGALVPHFGGRRPDATADVYAARSRFFYGVFADDPDGVPDGVDDDDNFRLHRQYSASGFDCRLGSVLTPGTTEDTCPQMQNPDNVPFWIPMISGVLAFEGVEAQVSDTANVSDVMVVVPEPQLTVMMAGGGQTVIYAGSIIHPRTGMVIPSVPITVASRLILPKDAAAAVDVSPVAEPIPVRRIRNDAIFQAWDMPLPPVQATAGSEQYIIEPRWFSDRVLVDFANDPRVNNTADADESNGDGGGEYRQIRSCDSAPARLRCRFAGSTTGANQEGRTLDIQVDDADYPDSDITIRYDGTRARGFLTNDKMTDILATYYNGEEIFSNEDWFRTYFPRRGYDGPKRLTDRSNTLKFGHRGDRADDYNAPIGHNAAQIGNPLSWHWINRTEHPAFIPMGMARQFSIPRNLRLTVPNILSTLSVVNFNCGYKDPHRYPAAFPQYPDTLYHRELPCVGFPEPNNDEDATVDYPLEIETSPLVGEPDIVIPKGPVPYYWVGVTMTSDAIMPNSKITVRSQSVEEDMDEFLALRLPHFINIPGASEIPISPHAFEQNAMPYPNSTDKFFQFPEGSIANVLQVDAASWESVHPYVSRYLPGAILSNDGGIYPQRAIPTSITGDDANNSTRRLLAAAEQMEVQEDNDGHRRIDVGGRRVVHYAKTETTPGDLSYSSTEVYTNVWIRLSSGGYLIEDGTDKIINLPIDTIINPILGTYLPGDVGGITSPPVRSTYQAYADIDPAHPPLIVSRPALTIPAGATVRVGSKGAHITNVKAAAIFSLRPINNVECSFGDVENNFPAEGLGTGSEQKTISQMREGVSENQFDATGTDGILFTLGHPCAWVDDDENTDGDRFFVYRSRRRYADDVIRTRVISNDRTYLLGGRLLLS